MKLSILTEEKNEEIVFPSNVFALGLEYNGLTIINGMDILLPNVITDKNDIVLANGDALTIILYSSNDESYHKIMAKFEGMKLAELSLNNSKITITI